MKRILLALSLVLAFGCASGDQFATTEKGMKVILHSDKTWEYVKGDEVPKAKPEEPQKEELVPEDLEAAVLKWKKLRQDPLAHRGETYTWQYVVWDASFCPNCVKAQLFSYLQYNAELDYGDTKPRFRDDEILVVKGKFTGVNPYGDLVMTILDSKVVGKATGRPKTMKKKKLPVS